MPDYSWVVCLPFIVFLSIGAVGIVCGLEGGFFFSENFCRGRGV